MSSTPLSPAGAERRRKREARQLRFLRRESARPKSRSALWYTLFLVTVVFALDEVCVQIGTQMQSVVALNLFSRYENPSATMNLYNYIALGVSLMAFLYKPLADQYGRKVFLVLSTLGEGLAMLIISLATNIPVWVLGATLASTFWPRDMHAVYVCEIAPEGQRASFYSLSKGIATLGMFLVGFLRTFFMPRGDSTRWRCVYLVPGLLTLAAAVFALFFLRETDSFVQSRLHYLSLSEEEREAEDRRQRDCGAQGGSVNALRFIAHSRQLRAATVAYSFLYMGMIFTIHYENIISIGVSLPAVALRPGEAGFAHALTAARQLPQTVDYCSRMLLVFPLGSALVQLSQGFISDRFGRKVGAALMDGLCLINLVLFFVGSSAAMPRWNPYVVGFFCGSAVGAFYAGGDILSVMISESTPTNMRMSVAAMAPLVAGVSYGTVLLLFALFNSRMGDVSMGFFCLLVTAPAVIGSMVVLLTRVRETRGTDLNALNGEEFFKKTREKRSRNSHQDFGKR